MPKSFKPIDLTNLTTYPIANRKSKVSIKDFAEVWEKGGSFADFLKSLPGILAAEDILSVISAISYAFKNKRSVILGMGAHVIKVGLNPVIIDLMQRGIITGIAMNGAGIIHDFELAMIGQTSEDVAASIGNGSFGMASETGKMLTEAMKMAQAMDLGLGEAVGRMIVEKELPLAGHSILAVSAQLGIPVTVHMAIGTDIIHMHPDFDPEAAAGASHLDFRTFASMVASLEGGVYINVGSAVILPEVFLKAITLVRNLGHRPKRFTTVNMDFVRHYRPMTNVVHRPTMDGGRGINLVGHHEIMLPLIAAGVIEQIEEKQS